MEEKSSSGFLSKPEKLYHDESDLDITSLTSKLTLEQKKNLMNELMSQLGENTNTNEDIEPQVDEVKKTNTNENWFESFEDIFKEKLKEIKDKVDEPKSPVENQIKIDEPKVVSTDIPKTDDVKPTEAPITTPTPTKIKQFIYEKPQGWNKPRKKTNILKVIGFGLIGKDMDAKDLRRYDRIKSNVLPIIIIGGMFFAFYGFLNIGKYDTDYNSGNKSSFDKTIDVLIDKYDEFFHRNDNTNVPPVMVTDTIKKVDTIPVIKDTLKKDVVVNVVKDTIVMPVKDTLPKVKVNNLNTKQNLVKFIKTLPDYINFGPKDLPYLTQDSEKTNWSFIRADGKTVHFHFNTLDSTFTVVN